MAEDPFEETERTEEARQRWRERFKARVEAMAKLLERAPEDRTPTPSTEE